MAPSQPSIAELGWLGLIYSDTYGGIEGSFFDLFILFEEMGKVHKVRKLLVEKREKRLPPYVNLPS